MIKILSLIEPFLTLLRIGEERCKQSKGHTMTQQRKLWTFYIIILTQTFSMIGSRISGLAIGFYIFNQTGEATPLALVSFFAVLPMVLASGVSGVMADRWDRRYVMILSDAGQAVGTVLLMVSFLSGDFQLWHLYVVTFLNSIFGVFQGPAFQASVTMLIPDNQRDRANAIQQLTGPMAGIIAPAVAGVVYAAVGVTGAIAIDLFTFLTAIAVIVAVRIPKPVETAEGKALKGSVWKEALGGLQYLVQRRTLFFLMLFISLVNFLFAGAMALSTPYILSRTGSESTLGLLLGIMNVGALLGGIAIGVWGGTRPRMHTMMPAMMISAASLAFIGTAQSATALGIGLFLLMLPLPAVNALFFSMMQAKVAPDIQGRVFAVLGQVSMLLTPLSYLVIGPLADRVFEPAVGQPGWEAFAPLVGNTAGAGFGLIMLVAGAIVFVTSVVVYAIPATRKLESNLPDYVVETSLDDSMPMVEAAA
jgi:MFS transporter, DHA3 family, macrolide efflux protein